MSQKYYHIVFRVNDNSDEKELFERVLCMESIDECIKHIENNDLKLLTDDINANIEIISVKEKNNDDIKLNDIDRVSFCAFANYTCHIRGYQKGWVYMMFKTFFNDTHGFNGDTPRMKPPICFLNYVDEKIDKYHTQQEQERKERRIAKQNELPVDLAKSDILKRGWSKGMIDKYLIKFGRKIRDKDEYFIAYHWVCNTNIVLALEQTDEIKSKIDNLKQRRAKKTTG